MEESAGPSSGVYMGVPAVSSGRMPAMGIPILMMTRESNDEGLTSGELHYIHGPTISGRPPTLEMERAPNDESRGLSGEMRTGTRASISIGGKQEKQQTSSRPQATSLRGTSKTSTWALSMAYKKNDKEFIHILEGSDPQLMSQLFRKHTPGSMLHCF